MVEAAQRQPGSRSIKSRACVPVSTHDLSFRSFSTNPKQRPRLSAEHLAELHARETAITAKLERTLNTSSHHLALISRVGCDLGRFRFDGEAPSYTHTGFAIRDGGEWRVYQMLNTHGGPEGHLYWQSLVDFFRDDPHEYRCAILVPSKELQYQLFDVLSSPVAERLYTSRYNRVAYPFSTRYQNSNQWVAELIAAAQSGRRTRSEVQDYLSQRGMSPSILRTVSYPAQALVAMFASNTKFDDHPLGSRLASRIAFITETSIRAYLQRTDRISLDKTLRLESAPFSSFYVDGMSPVACGQ